MSAPTTNAATNTNATTEAINDNYEYIQYNNQLRIIHSKQDDLYQMQSIIIACKSKGGIRGRNRRGENLPQMAEITKILQINVLFLGKVDEMVLNVLINRLNASVKSRMKQIKTKQ